MYDNKRFYKGEDIRFFVTIRDNDGQLENITDNYQDLMLYFYNEGAPFKKVVKASKRELKGFIPIVKAYQSDKGDYVYECIIDSKTTEFMPCGQYIVETNVARVSSTEFTEQDIVVTGGTEDGVKSDLGITFDKKTNKLTATSVLFTSTTEPEYRCNLEATFNDVTGEFKGNLSKLDLNATEETSYPYGDGAISGRFAIKGDFVEFEANGKWETETSGDNDNYDRSGKKIFKISARLPFTYTDPEETTGVATSMLDNPDAAIEGTLKTGVKYHKLNNIGRARAFKLSDALIKKESDIAPWEMNDDKPHFHPHGHHGTYVPREIYDRHPHCPHHFGNIVGFGNSDLSDDDRGYYRN